VILLLGGTSETAPIADALLAAGYDVLVSTATAIPLVLPPRARRRVGRLDEEAMARVVRESAVKVIVDATHPYAQTAHEVALRASEQTHIPCIRWARPASNFDDEPRVHIASSHEEAARMACTAGRTVLLTVGSQHVAPYASEAASHGCRLVARVLPVPESVAGCHQAGIAEADVIAARGPFTVEENRAVLRQFGIDVLVTKDGGAAGGLPAKITAARHERCEVVLIRRQPEANRNQVHTIAELLDRIGPRA
jgi:precorrin-6A/cobalt-precorrin-6A reductase